MLIIGDNGMELAQQQTEQRSGYIDMAGSRLDGNNRDAWQ